MNWVILIFLVLILTMSIFWLVSKKGVWERRIAVATAILSLIGAIWQISLSKEDKLPPQINAENNSQSPISGHVEQQINNYYPVAEQNQQQGSIPEKILDKVNPKAKAKLTSKIKGRVIDEKGGGIDKVQVIVGESQVYTNFNGDYSIEINFKSTTEEVRIIFSKSGFLSTFYYANSAKEWMSPITLNKIDE